MNSKVRIHVITYRRVHLLKRALHSILSQSHTNWVAEVLNDDPNDNSVLDLINSLNDNRIFLSKPSIKRGGTGNFNFAFRTLEEKYATILEDDNWYEQDFLTQMINALEQFPESEVAVSNELIWKELPNNHWQNSGNTIWQNSNKIELFYFDWIDKCGKAKVCNSSMVWRTKNAQNWKTPSSIPIDITEHYRERILPHPIILVYKPLVNYAQTIQTFRAGNENKWIIHQSLLIASVFAQTPKEINQDLAVKLWQNVKSGQPFLATSLINASFISKESRILIEKAPFKYILRYFFTFIKRFWVVKNLRNAKKTHQKEWEFLKLPIHSLTAKESLL